MQVTIKKNKMVLKIIIPSIIFIVLSIIIGRNIYLAYYYIDTSQFDYNFTSFVRDSPDEEKCLYIEILKDNEYNDTSYILAEVSGIPNENYNRRRIFWKKVDSDSLINVDNNGNIDKHWVNFEWIDSDTVQIEGVNLNVYNDFYDYRRDMNFKYQ